MQARSVRDEAGVNVRGSQKNPPRSRKAQHARKKQPVQPLGWDDVDNPDAAARPVKALTKQQAQALRAKDPPVSPWRVVGTQAGLGVVLALCVALFTSRQDWAWSLLYGAATVVMPGALMARGMTSRLSSMSPGASAGSFMVWEAVKVLVSVAMLLLAPKVVQPLSWPALLAGLVLCMQVYWVALLWRGRRQ